MIDQYALKSLTFILLLHCNFWANNPNFITFSKWTDAELAFERLNYFSQLKK